jgi:hypothetical protein
MPRRRRGGFSAAMPGAGLEPARPARGTPDFKSGAYHQFRHPGGPQDSPRWTDLDSERG